MKSFTTLTTDRLVAPAMMATRLEYCVQVKENEETGLVDMFLDTSQASMQWKKSSCSADSAVRMDSFFLKGLIVNPTEFSQTEVPQEWSTVVLLALYYGNELNEVTTTNKSIWYSVHNKIAFAIACNSVRGAAQTNFQKLQLRASKSNLMFGQKKQKEILPVQPVETETVRFEPQRHCETMAKFLQMSEKNGGRKQDSCHKVPVTKCGYQISFDTPENELGDDKWTHMTTVRMLEPWEKVVSDFSKSETLSTILEQFQGGKDKRLNVNKFQIDNVIKAAQILSSPSHSVRADGPFVGVPVVHKVTVDVDSVSATFKHRKEDIKRTIDNIFPVLKDWAQKDTTLSQNFTSWMPNRNTLHSYPSNGFKDKKTNRRVKCCGPTIEIHPDGGYSRIQLPTPKGAEVLKMWIYAPDAFVKSNNFVKEVEKVVNECALGLVATYESLNKSTLQSAVAGGLKGYKAFEIPGGYFFPISVALLFLEKYQECSFLMETYNCKKKGLEFSMRKEELGTDGWLNELTGKMKSFVSENPSSMLKMFCRMDRMAKVQPDRSKIGFGFQIQYKDSSGNTLYSLCQPDADNCSRVTEFPMAFLPSELASRTSLLKNGVRVQSYIPLWNMANYKHIKQARRKDANLGLKHCMDKDHAGALLMNLTDVLRGAKEEQKMIDDICGRFPNDFCERVEIAVPWILGRVQKHGPLCYVNNTQPDHNRWLDLKTMLSNSFGYIRNDTKFWPIGPIADYVSLNFAATLALYQTSARGMADTSLLPMERDQLCQYMVYLNYLLRIAKDGKLWQSKNEDKLAMLTRGVKCGREMMLPPVPGRVYSLLAAYGGVSVPQFPTMLSVASDQVTNCSSTTSMIVERILANETEQNDFGKRVLRCRTCNLGFYGGSEVNGTQLYVEHLQENPSHRAVSGLGLAATKMKNKEWSSDYAALLKNINHRYQTMYNDAQKRGYDAIMVQQKSSALLGVAGAGKSLLVQDLLPLLRCIFWKIDEVQVCGATNVVAQRADEAASTFHSFLGIRCDEGDNGQLEWNFSTQQCLEKIDAKKDLLKKVRVVIIEEGLELPSNLLEAYFHHININRLNIITIVNGDCCQGSYRENEQTGKQETNFFANPIKLAQFCPTLEIIPFTIDQRTKNPALKMFKHVVRNAQANEAAQKFVAENSYQAGATVVDIVLCARIIHMTEHNLQGLQKNMNPPMTFTAQNHAPYDPRYFLNYRVNGVSHSMVLKQGAPVMIMQHYKTACGKILRNGTLGTVKQLINDSVHVEVKSNRGAAKQFEIKRVQIGKTVWHQFPLHVAYAGTIAKCIGFEFESIAIDFGIENDRDCKAPWRRKQAYTAISRAKQRCYFIGQAPVDLLNNMDMNALRFFNRQTTSNQRQAQSIGVVRNVFEMREFWVRHEVSRGNKRARGDASFLEEGLPWQRHKEGPMTGPITGKTVADNKDITVFASTYPTCVQKIDGQGHILAATSEDHKQLLLKRYENALEGNKSKHENGILNTCKDMQFVLKLVAVVDNGIVLESMAGKVKWKDFVKKSTVQAKQAFIHNLSTVEIGLKEKQIAHGNISNKTAWVDIAGNVKLTWFQDAKCPATTTQMDKDRSDIRKLATSLLPDYKEDDSGMEAEDGNSVDFGGGSSVSSSTILSIVDDEKEELEISNDLQNADMMDSATSHDEQPNNDDRTRFSDNDSCSHSSIPREDACSKKCVSLQGNMHSTTRVDSPITWLLDACVELNLFPANLREKHNDETLAYWLTRDVAQPTANRHRTGGGITDTQFWPNILKTIRQKAAPPPSSIPMVFTDFGSELFLQGLLCALLGDFHLIVGIEINIDTFDKSVQLANVLIKRAQRECKFISEIQLHHGNFLNHAAILDVTARSTVVYANNVVFGHNINAPLVELWQKHLPAGAAMVVFDQGAILSSESKRIIRSTHEQIHWTQPIARTTVSVSWKPGTKVSIFVWRVSPAFKKLRIWAASASFADLLGWADYYGRAYIIDGANRSSFLPQHVTVFSNSMTLIEYNSALQVDTQSIFLAVTSSNKDYINACKKNSRILQDPSTRANLNFFCVVDCSDEQHPVLSILLQKLMKLSR